MSSYAGRGRDAKPQLLVVKGSFSSMGGAERDILRNLPHLLKLFSIKVATLDTVIELESLCENLKIPLLKNLLNQLLTFICFLFNKLSLK